MLGVIGPKAILKYTLMPQVVTRINALCFSGFGYIPYFLAVVYQMVGLLPRHHPYLSQNNVGRFGIRHVVAEAARNLTFSWKNIDQIILFVAVMAGIVIFTLQILAIGAVLFFQPAHAIPTTWGGFFTISDPAYRAQDLASIMLDMVFGVPNPAGGGLGGPVGGFFESCIGIATQCQNNLGANITDTASLGGGIPSNVLGPFSTNAYTIFPFPLHVGIHRLFAIYSTGLLVIAVFITFYFIATILAETAQSGTPFGKRFNKAWAPIRIVVAFGLLVPLTVGLNSSQYLVLYAAKYGSAFASNGWRYFNTTLTTSYAAAGGDMVSVPHAPELNKVTEFMHVVATCRYINEFYAWIEMGGGMGPLSPAQVIQAYIIGPDSASPNHLRIDTSTTYDDMIAFLGPTVTSATIRFGVTDPVSGVGESEYDSNIRPVCGEITMTLVDAGTAPTGTGPGEAEPGPYWIQFAYYTIVTNLWHSDGGWLTGVDGGTGYAAQTTTDNHRHKYTAHQKIKGLENGVIAGGTHDVPLNATFVNNVNTRSQEYLAAMIQAAVAQQLTSASWGTFPLNTASPMYQKGWAAAGIWYNRISEMNGQVTAIAYGVPQVAKFPEVMELVAEIKKKQDRQVNPLERFRPEAANLGAINDKLKQTYGYEFAVALNTAFEEWSQAGDAAGTSTGADGNAALAIIQKIFGTSGLYDMRNNATTHPLAQLSGIGRALVESSIDALGYTVLVSIGGRVLPNEFKAFARVSANFLVMIAILGLTIGIVLFYIIPFLPFIYFFFAVGGWIKGIFEALVGAPLWALAHIRIDGEGLMGRAAINGYFLIFEVFIRPILILFGMLASVTIYSALVSVLNDIFSLVTDNLSGHDLEAAIDGSNPLDFSKMRGLIDEFFFTVIYAIIVYMLGMSSFKLIDTVPNNILRWMGQSVATFGDQRDDPAQALVSRASMGSTQVLSKAGGGLTSMAQAGIGGNK